MKVSRKFVGSIILIGLFFILVPFLTHAATNYVPLASLPVVNSNTPNPTDLNNYLPNVVKLVIGLAGAFAVIRIIVGGIKYMTSEAFGDKSDAKETIENSIIGLLLAISAFIILNTLNPNLVKFNVNLEGLNAGAPISTDLGSTTPMTVCNDGTPAPNGNPANCGGVVVNPTNSGNGCDNCAPLPGNVPRKSAPPAGTGCKVGPCVVDKQLGLLLGNLATALGDSFPWQVTEMYPPYASHDSSCHKPGPNAGKCVDASLTLLNDNNLAKFLNAIKDNVGTNFQYEVPCYGSGVCTDPAVSARVAHIKGLVPGVKVIINTGAIGEHAHINGPGIVSTIQNQ